MIVFDQKQLEKNNIDEQNIFTFYYLYHFGIETHTHQL